MTSCPIVSPPFCYTGEFAETPWRYLLPGPNARGSQPHESPTFPSQLHQHLQAAQPHFTLSCISTQLYAAADAISLIVWES